MGTELFLVLFDKTYGGLFGHVDRIFKSDIEARLYCTAQNRVSIELGFEHWIVIIHDDGTSNCYAERQYKPAITTAQ
jgi:hypothetical protein